MSIQARRFNSAAFAVFLAGMSFNLLAQSVNSQQSNAVSAWWNGPNATGDWLGLEPSLHQYGLTVSGVAKQLYFGQLSGGLPNQPKSNFVNEEKLTFLLDFEKLCGVEGLTFSSTWRYRNLGSNPQFAAGTPSMFNPTSDFTGLGVRVLPQYFEYSTPGKNVTISAGWENPYELFLQQPLSKFFENTEINALKGIGAPAGPGIFVVNPNAAVNSAGVPTRGAVQAYKTSPVPWISSYASWGGTLKVKPTASTYIQSGLYSAIANEIGVAATQYQPTSVYPYTSVPKSYLGQFKTSGQIVLVAGVNGEPIPGKHQNIGYVPGYNQNHGFNFQGSPTFNPNVAAIGVNGANYGNGGNYSADGIFNVNEVGWTPNLGPDKLDGHYAIGSYIWGQQNSDYTPVAFTQSTFNPQTGKVVYTSYGASKPVPTQVNQVVWGIYLQGDQRLYAVKEPAYASTDADKGTPSRITDKGLYMFNECSFTPPQNNQLPYYFQTGLVYKGLLPHRDFDSIGIALGAGFYSSYYNAYLQSQNHALENAFGSPYNATVPNGPVARASVNPVNGQPSEVKTYWAYQPAFSSTEVVEAFYNIQLNKWASLKPFAQFIANPAGNGTVNNDWILGLNAKVTF